MDRFPPSNDADELSYGDRGTKDAADISPPAHAVEETVTTQTFVDTLQASEFSDAETTSPSQHDALVEQATWLYDRDFVQPIGERPRTNWRPGPGLLEATGWCLGFHVAQIMAGIAVVVGILLTGLLIPSAAEDWQSRFQPLMLGGVQFSMVLIVLAATRLRLGRRTRALLRTGSLSITHAVLVALLVLPLSILSSLVYEGAAGIWERLIELAPWLAVLDSLNSMDSIEEMVGDAPLAMLIAAIGIVPALTEELVFRGVIGRGLIARWGVVAGVLITSFLFAIVHLHPVHAAGVFALGVAMHLVYLATRSILAPMLLHCLNNSMAVLLTKFTTAGEGGLSEIDQPTSPWLLLASLLLVAAVGYMLWRTRVRFRLADDTHWKGPTDPLDTLPQGSVIHTERRPAGAGSIALVFASTACFFTIALSPAEAQPSGPEHSAKASAAEHAP